MTLEQQSPTTGRVITTPAVLPTLWISGLLASWALVGALPSIAETEVARSHPSILGLPATIEEADALEVLDWGATRVAVLDENGNGIVDRIEDVYLYDHGADGTIDRAIDWTDLDGDGSADRQAIYYLSGVMLGPGLTCLVIEARGPDSGFWATTNGQYVQRSCQFYCDFHGNSFFTALRWNETENRWIPFDERPFCFYDRDGDGQSDETLRVSGTEDQVKSIRWSFDTDSDASPPTPAVGNETEGVAEGADGSPAFDRAPRYDYSQAYDYDFSLTALTQTFLRPAVLDTLQLRNGTATRLLSWQQAGEWARAQPFRRVLLTFDENDRNIDPADPGRHTRWEGVIGKTPGRGFPQVGNPHCGALNKRYETRGGTHRPIEIYVSEVDGRVHLKDATRGWIDIDRDDDGKIDDRLEMQDRDEDGFFDLWIWDAGADGTPDAQYDVSSQDNQTGSRNRVIPITFEALRKHEEQVFELTKWEQGERFAREIETWSRLGRFVPVDSLVSR